MVFALTTAGRVGGRTLVFGVVVGCWAGVSSRLSGMASKGRKGSRGGNSGRAFEKRERPVLGGSREDGFNMMGAPPFGIPGLIYRDCVRTPPFAG